MVASFAHIAKCGLGLKMVECRTLFCGTVVLHNVQKEGSHASTPNTLTCGLNEPKFHDWTCNCIHLNHILCLPCRDCTSAQFRNWMLCKFFFDLGWKKWNTWEKIQSCGKHTLFMGFLPKKKSFKIPISFRGNPTCVGEVVTSTVDPRWAVRHQIMWLSWGTNHPDMVNSNSKTPLVSSAGPSGYGLLFGTSMQCFLLHPLWKPTYITY